MGEPLTDKMDFFLGGHDLEMSTIRDLLERHAPDRFCDKGLAWGARASDYQAEIEGALERKQTPVLIELTVDLDLPKDRIVIIDHHGQRAGSTQPTSLHQVFEILNLPATQWTRWHELVAANDRGYVPAMLDLGATKEEVSAIRAADRKAQGVTPEEEEAAERALSRLRILADGALAVATLPHAHTAPLCDRLEPALGGIGFENLLIDSPDQLNFFGKGNLIYALNEGFPGGWYGGALPERGFWGHQSASLPSVRNFLLAELARNSPVP
jgi:hypothetical protein